ncbi:hypothetical protein GTQ99_05280, partial [Kineococcus sp. T13]
MAVAPSSTPSAAPSAVTVLGPAHPGPDVLAALTRAITGEDAHTVSWSAHAVPYVSGSPATAGLHRVRGITATGRAWSAFLKVLQHPRHWNRLHEVPQAHREGFLRDYPWRMELDAWQPAFGAALPAGLRVPALHRLVELGDDKLAVWMEDVEQDPAPWDDERFTRAARLLGAFAARRCGPAVPNPHGVPP